MGTKIKLWMLALGAAIVSLLTIALKNAKIKQLQKDLLLKKHTGEWDAVRKDLENAKTNAKTMDEKARVADINYRAAVRQYRDGNGS